ncbi:MAG: 4Fe-4S binding protein [Gracilibacteraceae bacterium]|jgi:anaerobic dimethyl sulfoxide reductase subunit B (iron-sulfur subunit)|nr:4Fe-4S binding protein [Gracilibacteraceae bacterium]
MGDLILFGPERCVACYACAVACMDQNDVDPSRGESAFRAVFERESVRGGQAVCDYLSVSCMHCEDPYCVKVCPTGCLRKDQETGMTVYDHSVCIGCRSCAQACPFGVPRYNDEGRLLKCDGCHTRLKAGYEAACVRACPHGALSRVSKEAFALSLRRKNEAIMLNLYGR